MKKRNLSDLMPGEKCRIKQVTSAGSMGRRLKDLGIIDGTKVECLFRSPFGDPTAFYVRGAVIALRASDGVNILIESSGTDD